jgi:hypothetical protein
MKQAANHGKQSALKLSPEVPGFRKRAKPRLTKQGNAG